MQKNPSNFGPRPKIPWPGDLMGDQMYHFIHLTLMLFRRDRLLGVHIEHIRKQQTFV